MTEDQEHRLVDKIEESGYVPGYALIIMMMIIVTQTVLLVRSHTIQEQLENDFYIIYQEQRSIKHEIINFRSECQK